MNCTDVGQCGILTNMPAKRPKKKMKKPPLRRMSGEELRNWRLKHDLSQQELAELLGVSQKAISHWERGERKIPLYLAFLLEVLEKEGYVD